MLEFFTKLVQHFFPFSKTSLNHQVSDYAIYVHLIVRKCNYCLIKYILVYQTG